MKKYIPILLATSLLLSACSMNRNQEKNIWKVEQKTDKEIINEGNYIRSEETQKNVFTVITKFFLGFNKSGYLENKEYAQYLTVDFEKKFSEYLQENPNRLNDYNNVNSVDQPDNSYLSSWNRDADGNFGYEYQILLTYKEPDTAKIDATIKLKRVDGVWLISGINFTKLH